MTAVTEDPAGIRLGIDVGGTFTDAVLWDESTGEMRFAKVLSTPGKFADAVINVAHEVLDQAGLTLKHVARLVHGSTVAANVVAERRGSKVGLLTTLGFRDVLELQRTRRDVLFDLYYEKPKPIVPRYLRLEVRERMDATGQVLTPLDETAAREAIRRLKSEGCRSIAVCFLFSFLNPSHERRVKDLIDEEFPEAYVSLSSNVNPEFREYERTSTTVVDAYIRPEVTAYYNDLEQRLRGEHGFGGRFDIVHSGGGVMAVRDAADRPVKTIESGPAAGAIAAAHISRLTGIDRAIALDMGGTTAKACLIENGRLKTVNILKVERHPVRAPLIDLVEISGGGGTLAWIDSSGLLRLGPRSAGALPGPACYGRGGELPTITDANVVLGYYPVHLTGGSMRLDAGAARRAVREHIGERLGMTEEQAALGILRIANADMEGAIRLVTTQRGIDPRLCTLIGFGGAGPVHAAFLAQQLGIPKVLIPPAPGNVNAFGALVAETRYDKLATFYHYLNEVTDRETDAAFRHLESDLLQSLADLPASDRSLLVLERFADIRYVGQGYEITVPMPASRSDWKAQLANAFHEAHQAQFKHAAPGSPLQFVALRTVASLAPKPVHLRVAGKAPGGEGGGTRPALFPGSDRHREASVWERVALSAGWKVQGPAIVEEFSSTTVIPPGCGAEVDSLGNLLIHVRNPLQ